MEGQTEQNTIKVTAGISGATEIFVDDTFARISEVYKREGNIFKTFSLDEKAVPYLADTILIPTQPSTKWYSISFSNGLAVVCTKSTLFLTDEGYISAPNLVIGLEINELIYDIATSDIMMSKTKVIATEYKEVEGGAPAYYFLNQNSNMLIPAYNESLNKISFINIMQ